ncbi:PH domain-containing protein [Corynebacterium endometrii]|uniref:Low molecular weight protein antigen 6 PH domain-containing protein n=1 Tax=Corynebacterium endometrii TaxID=2488819 RepID=A0A4P7QI05_9CORY|nr:PH domain-containing protein [Corynebacterium endometrii]QCB28494.1 hypothetical protein CENDO_06075 [Corynebacterium endometrii]
MTESHGPTQQPQQEAASSSQMSELDVARYTNADPFALTSNKPWELTVSSPFLKKVAIAAVLVCMAWHIFMGVTVGLEYTGAAVTTIDRWAYPLVGVILSVLLWLIFTRPRVRANSDGVEVRNIVGTRFYPWQVIYGLSFPEGEKMARLELPEFEYVTLWAFQSADKAKVIKSVRQFRELEAKYMPQD